MESPRPNWMGGNDKKLLRKNGEIWTIGKFAGEWNGPVCQKNRRRIESKWVFKIKRDGKFCARIAACGYSQIARVDFKDNYPPVVNNISFRLLILTMLFFDLKGKIANVETAYLYGGVEEEIFMECPPGINHTWPNDILALQACI